MPKDQKPKKTCQRCGSDKVKAYGARWHCLACGWTFHQLNETVEDEVLTRLQTTGKLDNK